MKAAISEYRPAAVLAPRHFRASLGDWGSHCARSIDGNTLDFIRDRKRLPAAQLSKMTGHPEPDVRRILTVLGATPAKRFYGEVVSMTMQVEDVVIGGHGGEFATSRKGAIDYTEFEKIRVLCANSVSAQTIAFVIGRPVCDVLPVVACFPKGMREPYRAPEPYVEPKALVTFNQGGRAGPGPFLTVANAIAQERGVSVADLRGPSRTKLIAHARQEAFWRLRQATSISLPRIGAWFGDRDHTTVLHGVRAHQARLDAEAVKVAAE